MPLAQPLRLWDVRMDQFASRNPAEANIASIPIEELPVLDQLLSSGRGGREGTTAPLKQPKAFDFVGLRREAEDGQVEWLISKRPLPILNGHLVNVVLIHFREHLCFAPAGLW